MKVVLVLVAALTTGCTTMTPAQKRVALIATTVLVAGAIAANSDGVGSAPAASPALGPRPICTPQPDGSCR